MGMTGAKAVSCTPSAEILGAISNGDMCQSDACNPRVLSKNLKASSNPRIPFLPPVRPPVRCQTPLARLGRCQFCEESRETFRRDPDLADFPYL